MTTTPTKVPRWARRVLELAADDAQLQELVPDEAVLEAITRPSQSLEQIIAAALDGYARRPALGEREYTVALDPATGRHHRQLQPHFRTVTYYELHNRIKGLANAWRHHPHHRVDEGDFVCILGFSGTDFVTVDLACVYVRAVNVPLQTTLAGADLDGIFTDTAPTAVAATVTDLVLAAQFAGAHPSIRSIIAMDYDERVDDDREQLAAARTELAQTKSAAQLVTLDELVAFGDFQTWEPLPPLEDSDERMTMLLHSSGSTGTPKGAIILERHAKFQFTVIPPLAVPIVRLCFAPMNHGLGRGQVFSALARGGTAYFTAKPDMSTLFEDFRLVRPTEAAIFPRVLEMIHRHYLGEVARRRAVSDDGGEAIDAQVMEEMRFTFLGDRISMIVAGGAPTTPEVERFLTECFPVTLVDAYGTTEAGGSITVRNRVSRPPVIDYKLRDVPELGYYTTDKPYPRGELCVKTELSVPGYFKRPEATAALFDEEGYLRTGDIMEEREPDHLVYVDRRNDVLKLAQGEFVAAGALGNTFENGSKVIHQIYVYGNAARAYLLAVVVPNMEIVERLLGPDPSEGELKALIRSELQQVAETENLRSFEVPRDFIVEMEPFSHENGLLSSIHKRMRPNLQRKYGEALEQLYTDLERRQNDQLMALRDPHSDLSVLDKIGKALEATLGVEDLDVTQPYSFAELGGDSLGRGGALGAAVGHLRRRRAGQHDPQPGRQPATVGADDRGGARSSTSGGRRSPGSTARTPASSTPRTSTSRSSSTEPSSTIRRWRSHLPTPGPCCSRERTGSSAGSCASSGWSGWRAPTARSSASIRAADHEAATRRLAAAFEGDAVLEQRFRELSAGHLEVVVGDVAEPQLGVDDATYDRLARDVDRIVHPAALVNHMLDYEYLFGPNVAGTAELVGPGADAPPEADRLRVVVGRDVAGGAQRGSRRGLTTAPDGRAQPGLQLRVCGEQVGGRARAAQRPPPLRRAGQRLPWRHDAAAQPVPRAGQRPGHLHPPPVQHRHDGPRADVVLRVGARRQPTQRPTTTACRSTSSPGRSSASASSRTATSRRSTCSTITRTTASRWTPSSTGSRRPATGWSGSDLTVSGCSASRTSSRRCPRSSVSTPR